MGAIFISYRRDDSADATGRVYDHLSEHFGRASLFIDVDDIPAGADFSRVLRDEVARCDVMLVIIGPRWLTITDEHGRRRLDDPNDFVRLEVAAGLKRDIAVIPILVQGASVPSKAALPPKLAPLARRNAVPLRGDPHFRADVKRLAAQIERMIDRKNAKLREESADDLVAAGQALFYAEQYEQAIPILERAAAIDPHNPAVYHFLGEAYDGARRIDDAMHAFGEWASLEPQDPWPLHLMAGILSRAGRSEDALVAIDQAIAGSEDDPELWSTRASILSDLLRLDEALVAYDQALALVPASPLILWGKAATLRVLGRTAEAEDVENEAKAAEAEQLAALRALGREKSAERPELGG